MRFERAFQRARELGRRDLAHRGAIRLVHRFHQLTDPAPVARGDEVQRREIDERQTHSELRANQFALLGGQRIPFVDADHERAPAIDREAQQARVLLRDSLLRIEKRDHDVRGIDRLQGLDDAEALHAFLNACAAANSRGIDQRVAHRVALERNQDTVARGAGLVDSQ